ncbi:MAG: hypothetical protein JNK05_34180 [Myxococcales bacterium]|nr:hypothetical protein [Myxococcales bacterium]
MNRGILQVALSLPGLALCCAPTIARDRTPLASTYSRPSRADVVVPDAAAGTPSAAPSVSLLPIGYRTCVVGPDGARHFIVGGHRVDLTPTGARIGAEVTSEGIVLAAHTDGGWIFVSADGSALRSGEFVGATTRLPDLPSRVRAPFATLFSGRVAVVLERPLGDLYTTDGRGPFERVRSLAGVGVEHISFVDAQHGAVLSSDESLLVTSDGGARWTAARGATRLFSELTLSADGRRWVLFERETLRVRTLEIDGRVHDGPSVEPPVVRCEPTAQEQEALARVFEERYPQLERVVLQGDALLSARVRLEHPVTRARIELDGARCSGRRAIGPSWARCPIPGAGTPEISALAVVETATPPMQLRTIAALPVNQEIKFSDDGEYALWISDDPSGSAVSLNVAHRSSAVRRWPLAGAGFTVLAAMNQRAVLAVQRGASPMVALIDLRSGASVEHRLTPVAVVADIRATIAADGTVLFVVNPSANDRESFVVAPNSTPRSITVPSGASVAAMFDRTRGAAAGDGRALWTTDDGGVTWEPRSPHVDGVLDRGDRAIRLLSLACNTVSCDAQYDGASRLRVAWSGSVDAPRAPLTISRSRVVEPVLRRAILPRLACQSVRELPIELPPLGLAPPTALREVAYGGGGLAVLSQWSVGGRRMAELVWRGIDRAGPFEASSLAGAFDLGRHSRPWASPHLAAVDRSAALIVMCREGERAADESETPPSRCQYWIARAGAAMRPADRGRTYSMADSNFAWIAPDGRIFSWGTTGFGDFRAFDPRGARLGVASLSQDLEPEWRGIFRDGDDVRAVVTSPWSYPYLNTGVISARPITALGARIEPREVSVCRSAIAAGAQRLIVRESGGRESTEFRDAVIELAATSDGFCVERVDSAAYPTLTSNESTSLFARSDGSLVGIRTTSSGRDELRCTLRRPAAP